jgi:glycerate kinase
MKITIAPDKFKGSISSLEASLAIRDGIHDFNKEIGVAIFPMADGGDGFAEVMKHYMRTSSQAVQSVDSLGRKISSSYEWKQDDRTAIIELAACSGLAMLRMEERNPMITSTFGTGLQVKHAIEKGAEKIVLGLGGSSTNDAGIGILCALGFQFVNHLGLILPPCGESLLHIDTIIYPPSIPHVKFELACDVNNPLYGPDGAAIIFSAQKGADAAKVQLLDAGLRQFAATIKRHTGKDVSNVAGAGAAGGIAAGLMAYFNVNMVEGTQLIIQASRMEDHVDNTDIIITGEGKLDRQSLRGKTIQAITNLAREKDIPVVGVCGKLDLAEQEWKELGLSLAFEIHENTINEAESIEKASILLRRKSTQIMPLLMNLVKH